MRWRGGAEVVLGRQGSIQRVLNRVESLLLRLGSLECLLLGNQRMLLRGCGPWDASRSW